MKRRAEGNCAAAGGGARPAKLPAAAAAPAGLGSPRALGSLALGSAELGQPARPAVDGDGGLWAHVVPTATAQAYRRLLTAMLPVGCLQVVESIASCAFCVTADPRLTAAVAPGLSRRVAQSVASCDEFTSCVCRTMSLPWQMTFESTPREDMVLASDGRLYWLGSEARWRKRTFGVVRTLHAAPDFAPGAAVPVPPLPRAAPGAAEAGAGPGPVETAFDECFKLRAPSYNTLSHFGPGVEACGALYWPPLNCDTVLQYALPGRERPVQLLHGAAVRAQGPGAGSPAQPRPGRDLPTSEQDSTQHTNNTPPDRFSLLGQGSFQKGSGGRQRGIPGRPYEAKYTAPFTLGPDGNLYAAPYNDLAVLVVHPSESAASVVSFLEPPAACLSPSSLEFGGLYAAQLTLASDGVMYCPPCQAAGVLAVDARPGRAAAARLLPSSLVYSLLGPRRSLAEQPADGQERSAAEAWLLDRAGAIAASAIEDAAEGLNFGMWSGPLVEAGDGKLYCWPTPRCEAEGSPYADDPPTGGLLCVDPRSGVTRLLRIPDALRQRVRTKRRHGYHHWAYPCALVRGPDGALYLGPEYPRGVVEEPSQHASRALEYASAVMPFVPVVRIGPSVCWGP
jgi:hypothetical protein